jgi:mRNA capping enzyme/mRNA capping enzyme, catalytic domain
MHKAQATPSINYKQLLDNVIARFTSEPGLELEIRIKNLTKETFSSIYEKVNDAKDKFEFIGIEYSINTISENMLSSGKFSHSNYIRKQVFDETGRKLTDDGLEKTTIMTPVKVSDFLDYNVNLARETMGINFAVSKDSDIRFKIRASFYILPDKLWRIDITAVKTSKLSHVGPKLASYKSRLFIPMTADNYLETLPYDDITHFEAEAEYVGGINNPIKPLITSSITDVAKMIFNLISPSHAVDTVVQEEIGNIANHILINRDLVTYYRDGTYGMKRLLNQPKTLVRQNYYEIYPPIGYFVTEKANGIRCVVSINGNRCRLVTNTIVELFTIVQKTNSMQSNESHQPGAITIADSELITHADGTYSVMIFDVMYVNDTNLIGEPFSTRMTHLESVAAQVQKFVELVKSNSKAKVFVECVEDQLEKAFSQVYKAKYPYDIDGLILVDRDKNYFESSWYKWKPLEHNTIDFLAVKCPSKLMGLKPYVAKKGHDLYLLFVTIKHDMQQKLGLKYIEHYRYIFPDLMSKLESTYKKDATHYPIQFSPSANPLAYLYWHPVDTNADSLNGKIIEMKLNGEGDNLTWQFVHTRADRKVERTYYGNDYQTAELVYQNYLNPLKFEDLYNLSGGYFTHTADTSYKASNGFSRFVVTSLIKTHLCDCNNIVELMCGRGGDLHRYMQCKIKSGLFIDSDKDALMELISRKFDLIRDHKKQFITTQSRGHTPGLVINVMHADLSDPYEQTVSRIDTFGIPVGNYDAAISNFAMHYMCESKESVRNIIALITKIVKIGGIFVMTVPNGEVSFERLSGVPFGGSYKLLESDKAKYEIKKLYDGVKISDVGQKIAVKLPFADELKQEPLLNLSYMIKEFKQYGWTLEIKDSFTKMFDEFQKANTIKFNELTPADKEYLGIYYFVVLRRTRA